MGLAKTALPTALTWIDPEARHTIQIEFGNLLLWRHAVSSGGLAGLLLGSSRIGNSGRLTAYIQTSEPLIDNDLDAPEALEEAARAVSKQEVNVAGIWIIDTDRTLAIDEISQELPDLRTGSLLVTLDSNNATLHYWDSEDRKFQPLGLTFPTKPHDLATADYKPFRPMFLGGSGSSAPDKTTPDTSKVRAMPAIVATGGAAAAAAAPALEPQVSAPATPLPPARTSRTVTIAAGTSAALAAAAAGMLLWPRPKSNPPAAPTQQVIAPQQTQAQPPTPGLGLELNRSGSDLQLRWNRNSPVMASARGGSVAINDGTDHLVLALNREQLTTGRLIYTPQSRDVDFEVTIQTDNGRQTSESVRVVQAPPKPAQSARADQPVTRARIEEPLARVTPEPQAAARLAPEPSHVVPEAPAHVAPRTMVPPPVAQSSARIPSVRFPDEPAPSIMSSLKPATQPLTTLPSAAPPAPRVTLAQTTPVTPTFTSPVKLPPQLWSSLRTGTEVQLTAIIGPNGRVQSVRRPAEADTVRRAIIAIAANTVLTWQFNPAKINGTPVKGEYVVTFRFKPNSATAAAQ